MVVGLLGTYGTLLPDQAGVIAFVAAIVMLLVGMVVPRDLTDARPPGTAPALERALPSLGARRLRQRAGRAPRRTGPPRALALLE